MPALRGKKATVVDFGPVIRNSYDLPGDAVVGLRNPATSQRKVLHGTPMLPGAYNWLHGHGAGFAASPVRGDARYGDTWVTPQQPR